MDDWRQVKLSLEKPYDQPVLLDITPQGEHIYETKESRAQILGQNLRRIFIERGHDFFDRHDDEMIVNGRLLAGDSSATNEANENDAQDAEESSSTIMTTEELFKMRTEIMPQLHISLGEMTLARDLLNMILSSVPGPSAPASQAPVASAPNTTLSATVVSKPSPIASVQVFNAQLAIGGKDEALRKAADVFKTAAKLVEKSRVRSEKYWLDALRIRRANWGLLPAPLPFGSATSKGADRTTKDFLISFGLEESPGVFRRQAIARMATTGDSEDDVVFPYRQNTRLRVSLSEIGASGQQIECQNAIEVGEEQSVEDKLKIAQLEIVEQEIFSLLVKEAGTLPTVSARVSERLIVIDAAQGTELKFELVDPEEPIVSGTDHPMLQAKCDLIHHLLHALLLRRHAHVKLSRLGSAATVRELPLLLQPIIDLLQYQVFCERVKEELDNTVRALSKVGVSSTLRFNPIGEIGKELVSILSEAGRKSIGGDAVLRIDDARTIRLTLLTPSSLTVHLAQATLTIASIRQLYQLLRDEVEGFLLQRICEHGRRLSADIGGIWFVDLNRCVGRWDLGVLNFRIIFDQSGTINATVFSLNRETGKQGRTENLNSTNHEPLFSWVEQVISKALT